MMIQERDKDQIAVTCVFTIAKRALQIRKKESPTYDNEFVALGEFHFKLSFFKVLGKYIADFEASHILYEINLIEKGSLISFLTRNIKRCKRVHTLIALVVEILHFSSFQVKLGLFCQFAEVF